MSQELMAQTEPSRSQGDQFPDQKKVKMEEPHAEQDTLCVSTPAETAESRTAYLTCESGFEAAPKRKHKRGGVAHRKKAHEGGKSAPADLNQHKHGAEPVSLQMPSAKTQKVLQKKLAASKLAERASKATGLRPASALKAHQAP